MNGQTNQSLSQSVCAPGYSLLRDVNGPGHKIAEPAGRYTAVSKTTTKRNGLSHGLYQPTGQTSVPNGHSVDPSRRSQSQTNIGRTNGYMPTQKFSNSGYETNGFNGSSNYQSDSLTEIAKKSSTTQSSIDVYHSKSHSVSSTLLLRDTGREGANHSAGGGSLSCGQPSPSSTAEESTTSVASPNSVRITVNDRGRQITTPSLWSHQSELNLPTNRDFNNLTHNNRSIYEAPSVKYHSTSNGLESTRGRYYCRSSTSTLESNSTQYYPSSTMLQTSHGRNETDDYLNNYITGPSFRKIQNLHGNSAVGAQRRYPSDTTLNYNTREGHQVYTSGNKPGPVTIPARSRSAQPSPGPSPLASPTTFYRGSESNLTHDFAHLDGRSRITKPQQMDMTFKLPQPSGTSSPPRMENKKVNHFSTSALEDEAESPILPSVREIIRQVEAMTQSNAATSTTDISSIGHGGVSGIPRFQRQFSQPHRKPSSPGGASGSAGGGILRFGPGSSQRTPSAPQLRNLNQQYTPIQAKFNSNVSAAAAASNKTNAPPVPPHGTTRSKAIIGAFTRRMEPNYEIGPARHEFMNLTNPNKKIEQLSNLPTDYQKLREAFIEQRREIQRLRKQLAEKDILITQLQNDVRLYEPWR